VIVILSTVGALIYEEMSLGERPADPQVTIGQPEAHGSYFAVPVKVVNRGDRTAQGVRLQITLKLPGGKTEESSFNLQYLPRRAVRHAWVTFEHNPRRGVLEPRVLGYEKP
jgi:uncharacterized protein (TIGR02588 family)